MIVEIIAIGTEILLGDIVNTNAQYIAKQLADFGFSVYHQVVVGDNEERLQKCFDIAYNRSDIVITTGGLGPTQDDMSKELAAKFFNRKLVEDIRSYEAIAEYFKKRGLSFSENNKKQALIPEGSIVMYNDNGTAPGFILEDGQRGLIMLPGPPREMIPMFEKDVKPYLQSKTDGVLVSNVLSIFGIGEGHMEEEIKDIISAQSNPTIAPYAKDNNVIVRITAKAKNEEEAQSIIEPVKKRIYDRLGDNIYSEDGSNMEEVVARLLINKKLAISVAESCTGGLLAGTLINYPGISDVLKESIITYSNEAKMKYLNVKEETLKRYGAVSYQTALEMAEGIAKQCNSDVGIGVTGIAGPGGGTDQKPVGLVYVGLYYKGTAEYKKLNLVGDRQRIRNRTVIEALDFLRRRLQLDK